MKRNAQVKALIVTHFAFCLTFAESYSSFMHCSFPTCTLIPPHARIPQPSVSHCACACLPLPVCPGMSRREFNLSPFPSDRREQGGRAPHPSTSQAMCGRRTAGPSCHEPKNDSAQARAFIWSALMRARLRAVEHARG